MPDFIPGLKLAELFYHEAVKPILDQVAPGLRYSAALIGSGSEILGFDTERSTDHHWGPRLMVFLSEADFPQADAISTVLSERLPHRFHGYPTNFGASDEIGVQLLSETDSGPIAHRVEFMTAPAFFQDYLGFDPLQPIIFQDWLGTPQQKLRTITAGQVYYDGLGVLETARARLAYYPDDLWRYLLASEWARIAEEEPFVGRCGDVGDELGSRLIAARLIQSLMRLCFLMERQYAPYSKWFGTAFSRLKAAGALAPMFEQALNAADWHAREAAMSQAYAQVARMHNALGLTEPLSEQVSPFHDRPYLVIHGGVFADALRATITDPDVRAWRLTGSVDQMVDNVLVLSSTERAREMISGI